MRDKTTPVKNTPTKITSVGSTPKKIGIEKRKQEKEFKIK